ncbi:MULTISPECIES: sce7725 family protein [Sphingobium]|uniref:Sce7725 family protein n=1 Tax=Sphingobium agri TaxID=2933566 RepID=A0ABT0E1T6_9SPHN|nr:MULTISPECIES: sce7725 family protein [Sphingobium]MCK0533325.1 sce7725 family protein [Sphingobium agri]QPI73293.1 sce7725 family protein [Sphingobium sp. Cam5-1]
MYYPYFRGKQFELITIRETAGVMAQAGFVPIIEPVKETLKGLHRALQTVCEVGGKAIVIVNPYVGDHQDNGIGITGLLAQEFADNAAVSAGILLREDMNLEDAYALFEAHAAHDPVFVHAGFGDQKALADQLGAGLKNTRHVFIEKHASTLCRRCLSKVMLCSLSKIDIVAALHGYPRSEASRALRTSVAWLG